MGRARGTRGDHQVQVRDLGNLVTGALHSEEEDEATSLADVYSKSHKLNDVLFQGRSIEKAVLRTDDPDTIRKTVAPLATMYLNVGSLRSSDGMPSNPGTAMYIKLLDFVDREDLETLQDLRAYIRRTNNRLELRELLRSQDRTIAFLDDLWGDRACEKISGTTQTRPETVQKWLGGSSPSSSNYHRIQQIATVVYQLEKECGIPRKDIPDWLQKPHPDLSGKSAEDVFAFSGQSWSMPLEIRELLRSMGADL